jgi:hypothetical protein
VTVQPFPATVFSWILTVGGTALQQYNNMKLSSNVSGYGQSGCITAAFDFTAYSESPAAERAEVVLSCTTTGHVMTMPKFYISSRQIDGDVCNYHCLDGMVRAEEPFDSSGLTYDENNTVATSSVLSALVTQCGYDSRTTTGGASPDSKVPYMNKDDVENKTCRAILDDLSAACCGVWRIIRTGAYAEVLDFATFGTLPTAVVSVDKYTKIDTTGTKHYDGVRVTDGENTYTVGSVGASDIVLKINTSFATQALANYIWQQIGSSYYYNSWKCEKALVDSYIPAVSAISFTDGATSVSRDCNYISLYPTASGLYASLGANAVTEDEWDYSSSVDRKLDKKQTKGEKIKVFVSKNA